MCTQQAIEESGIRGAASVYAIGNQHTFNWRVNNFLKKYFLHNTARNGDTARERECVEKGEREMKQWKNKKPIIHGAERKNKMNAAAAHRATKEVASKAR